MKIFYYLLIFALLITSCNYKKTQKEQSEYNADYYFYQGLNEFEKGNYNQSLTYYNKAISLDSTVSNYFLNRGFIKIINSDTISALNDFKKSIQIDAHNAIAYYNMGRLNADIGNHQDASEFFIICMTIDPSYYPVYYNCAYSQYQIKDYYEALKNFEKAIQFDDDTKFYAYYYMGLIYKEKRDMIKAKSYFEKAAALGNSDAKKELK